MPVRRASPKIPAALLVALFTCVLLPSFASAKKPAEAEAIARSYLQNNQHVHGLDASDLREVSVSSNVPGTAPGMRHVYLQQNHRGIRVWNAINTVNVLGDGRVFAPENRFQTRLAAKAAGQSARRNAVQAGQSAMDFLELKLKQPLRAVANRGGPNQRITLSDGGVALRPIEAELVWYYARDIQKLRLSWRLQIETRGAHLWDVFVDAGTGEPLAAKDRVVHDSIAATSAATSHGAGSLVQLAGALVAAPPPPPPVFPSIDGASYSVYPYPFESPADGGRRSVSGAASPVASPYGWHDTNGAAGAEFTVTRGNNVDAYTDTDSNNIGDPGSRPEGGGSLQFAFPILSGQAAADYRPAAVTNLFYWTNIIHDIAYGYGFNEAAGNFQDNNYGKGGQQNDYLLAESQDGTGFDNANFSTPGDGVKPRMQMYLWTYPFPNVVIVNSPGSIAGNYVATGAVFGPSFATAGAKTAAFVIANDGTGSTSDGCEAFVGFPPGAIAAVDRGTCTFVVKVNNAQLAQAAAVVVFNNVAGDPISLGGTDATITIPAGMLSLTDGNRIRAQLPGNATAQANGSPPVPRDSGLDAGVVVHEYGHGISNRLTGGPQDSTCLENEEQMGEGWSDWFAATLTARASDVGSTRRGMATFLSFQSALGNGIRPTPYSTNTAINPATYASVANTAGISMPHGIGYVWNSMLWEMYWNLVHRYGFNPNLYEGWNTGGNNLAMQLVMDGMKSQPCAPGFVSGRTAILFADTALTGGANQCEIWRGFAKRGLGFSATQGDTNSRADGVEAFDLPAVCTAAVFGGFQPPIAASPTLNPVFVPTTQSIPLQFSATGLTGPLIIDTQQVNCATLEATSARPIALASAAGLQQVGNNYSIDWRPAKAWAGTCRAVTVRIPAASNPVAYFRFSESVPQKVSR